MFYCLKVVKSQYLGPCDDNRNLRLREFYWANLTFVLHIPDILVIYSFAFSVFPTA